MCINHFEDFKKDLVEESKKTMVINNKRFTTKRFKGLKNFLLKNASKDELEEVKKLNIPDLFGVNENILSI